MLGIILRILGILGFIALVLLLLVLFVLLLVLFYPITYRLKGQKGPWVAAGMPPLEDTGKEDTGEEEEAKEKAPPENVTPKKAPPEFLKDALVSASVKWLSGLIHVRFDYPKPGKLIVKAAGFTVFDSGKVKKKKDGQETSASQSPEGKQESTDGQAAAEGQHTSEGQMTEEERQTASSGQQKTGEQTASQGQSQQAAGEETAAEGTAAEALQEEAADTGLIDRIKALWEKILFTIRGICDKIKKIYETAEYYLSVMKEEDTKQLLSHVLMRVAKILKSIRPRKISGEILFGTGSPDTTGYVMAVYGMISPYLGKNLSITPDFEEKVLQGKLQVKGHIMLSVLAYNGLSVLLDRRLRKFIRKIKREVK